MSKSFNTLVSAIGRMYGSQASKYESLTRVFNGLVDPLNPIDQLGVATSIINKVVEDLKSNASVKSEDLRINMDELMEALTELDAVTKEIDVTEQELARNPI